MKTNKIINKMNKNNKIHLVRIILTIIVHILTILPDMLLIFTQLVIQFITALKKTTTKNSKKIKNNENIFEL